MPDQNTPSGGAAKNALREVLHEHTLMGNYIYALERGIVALAGLLREQPTGLREEALQRRIAHLTGSGGRTSEIAEDLRSRGLLRA